MGQDQVSGGVSVLCCLAAPVAMFYGSLQNLVIRSKSVLKSSSVISSQIGVMSEKIGLSLCNLKKYFLFAHVVIGNEQSIKREKGDLIQSDEKSPFTIRIQKL